jgi:hypothetical protein
VKWRNKRAGVKELQKLQCHARERSARGWYVSRAGFTAEAIRFAAENGLFITNGEGLGELRRLIEVEN